MSEESTYPLWVITIEPAAFPLAGRWLVAQFPNSASGFHGQDWFLFPSSGSPNDSEFTTTIGNTTYTFTVEHSDKDLASGTVTTPGQSDGTWSAQGSNQ
jgi:hypothetical protein